jgi:hypothetical protein
MNAAGGSPAVFLCNSCNTIISDTLELRGESVELSAYVVNGKCAMVSSGSEPIVSGVCAAVMRNSCMRRHRQCDP